MIIKLSNPMEAIRDGWKDGKREIDARVGKGVQVFDECVCSELVDDNEACTALQKVLPKLL